GQSPLAEPLYKCLLDTAATELGTLPLLDALPIYNLAGLYDAQGQYALAEPISKHSPSITQTRLGTAHADFSTRMNNLAELYR
ncbi:hypothetical protein OFB62_32045, partial [Escherichia coli]|nr:hypothetical protein [Escherichia coli]